MPATSIAHDKFIHDVFVTICEDGGTNSWRSLRNYHWSTDGGRTRDLKGFGVTVYDEEERKAYGVDRTIVGRGFSVIRNTPSDKLHLAPEYVADILSAYREKDAGNLDAFLADYILQAALFGEVVYG